MYTPLHSVKEATYRRTTKIKFEFLNDFRFKWFKKIPKKSFFFIKIIIVLYLICSSDGILGDQNINLSKPHTQIREVDEKNSMFSTIEKSENLFSCRMFWTT